MKTMIFTLLSFILGCFLTVLTITKLPQGQIKTGCYKEGSMKFKVDVYLKFPDDVSLTPLIGNLASSPQFLYYTLIGDVKRVSCEGIE